MNSACLGNGTDIFPGQSLLYSDTPDILRVCPLERRQGTRHSSRRRPVERCRNRLPGGQRPSQHWTQLIRPFFHQDGRALGEESKYRQRGTTRRFSSSVLLHPLILHYRLALTGGIWQKLGIQRGVRYVFDFGLFPARRMISGVKIGNIVLRTGVKGGLSVELPWLWLENCLGTKEAEVDRQSFRRPRIDVDFLICFVRGERRYA